MIQRNYTFPDKCLDEGNWAWCLRAVATIPEETMEKIRSAYLKKRKTKGLPAWSEIAGITAHGSGISAAIAERLGLND